jgi:hypothetical protein
MATTSGVLPVAAIDVSYLFLARQRADFQINYPEELARIEDFLTRFVADSSARRRQLPDDDDQEAEEEDEENADDLADAVDDLDVNGEERSKAKYMKVLRKVANRQSAAVIIDLNDVKEVSDPRQYMMIGRLTCSTPMTRRFLSILLEIHDDISSFSPRLSIGSCLNLITRLTIPPMFWMSLWIVEGCLMSSLPVERMGIQTFSLQNS